MRLFLRPARFSSYWTPTPSCQVHRAPRLLLRQVLCASALLLGSERAQAQQFSAFSAVAKADTLQAAVVAGDEAVFEGLLRGGADLEERERHGRTPLYSAARQGRGEFALALLRAGAQPSAANYAGMTPLHAAAAANHPELVRVLLANCADVDARDLQQRTPLFMAAARGHREIAELLLANGADLRARQKGGSTPLSVATNFHQDQVADLLRQRLAELPPVDAPAAAPAPLPEVEGERIRFVQQGLRALGYDPGAVDGQLSPGTRKAIQSFQKQIGQVIGSGKLSTCLVERVARETQLREKNAARAPETASTTP